ncbi:hypothetical protein GH714_025165 [Hevea brasiliensis]|uniref:Uncharacterized protein n=1 Tax=Hevea brasiliensis TaxID=3981 RepID=A0A6A6L7X8_HEVBR|nr:hypothetical protein GH714_025165 [Hevea brasiliensis]
MAEENKNHHLFHHHKEGDEPIDYKKEKKHHKHLEQLVELGAVAAGAYALHEKHQAKKDPEHAHIGTSYEFHATFQDNKKKPKLKNSSHFQQTIAMSVTVTLDFRDDIEYGELGMMSLGF